MPKLPHRFIAVICTVLAWLADAGASSSQVYGPESVVVVANRTLPESIEVARYYMGMRGIPDKNLILLEAPASETISRQVYLEKLHNPILTELLDRKLVNAFAGPVDELGRKTATIFKNRIRYVVLCRGIPARINATAADSEYADDEALLKRYFTLSNRSLISTFSSGRLEKNEASVDGELALLLERGTPLRGFVPNPLFGNRNRDALTDILRVTRLDGPSVDAVKRMLDSARNGELNGLRGRAYVDEDGRSGSFQVGNTWMANTAALFRKLGFSTSHDTAPKTFSADDRFDAPVLYAGWYAGDCNGPFTLPGFKFPDGAVAAHLHSFSAASIRSPTKGWVGPFVDRGVACTFGNVSEPYLRLTHEFDAFFEALSLGWNFADAAYYALPGLSWQGVAVGDPLYRPFVKTLEEQLENVGHPKQILSDQYVLMRQANLLAQSGEENQALQLLEQQFNKVPGPALALSRARFYKETGQLDKARSSLAFIARLKAMDSGTWGLLAETADELAAMGNPEAAVEIYDNLTKQAMPESTLLAFIRRGITVAEQSGNQDIARHWKSRLAMPGEVPGSD